MKPANCPLDIWNLAIAQCSNINSTWTPEIMAEMLQMYFEGKSISMIKQHLGRGYQTVYARLCRLGLTEVDHQAIARPRADFPSWVRYENFDRVDHARWFGPSP